MYELARTPQEIDDTLNICAFAEDEGGSAYPGMTYEQGIKNAIEWLTGRTDDNPLGDLMKE